MTDMTRFFTFFTSGYVCDKNLIDLGAFKGSRYRELVYRQFYLRAEPDRTDQEGGYLTSRTHPKQQSSGTSGATSSTMDTPVSSHFAAFVEQPIGETSLIRVVLCCVVYTFTN